MFEIGRPNESKKEKEDGFRSITLGGMVLSMSLLVGGGSLREGRRNSCIIQSVLTPLAALPL